MSQSRASGILAHPTSFPAPDGIGDLGDGAYRFIDWLASAGQRAWQVMPLVPTGAGDSPYSSPSAFAMNDLLVSLDALEREGLLPPETLANRPHFSEHEVEFGRVAPHKRGVLRVAWERWHQGAGSHLRADFDAFVERESGWLEDYALFMALKDDLGGGSWQTWPAPLKSREARALAEAGERLADEVDYVRFTQFIAWRQWDAVRKYANERDIRIIGDIPIYVALDSADVWANPELFQLDADRNPTAVAGVPPDDFAVDGQLWGNPVFDWPAHAAQGYAWWIDRIKSNLQQVDLIRIDHFRAFAAGWVVPVDAQSSRGGKWVQGGGKAVFDAIAEALGSLPLIVEDLGLITPDVHQLREDVGLPGMKVLQFAFSGDPDHVYLPHNYESNCVVYPGTHDNHTTIGWFSSIGDAERRQVQSYLGRDGSDIAWDFIRLALGSVSDLAIIPLQDVMRLGDDARMNVPGRPYGNWGWRYLTHQLHGGLAQGLSELTWTYGRKVPPMTPTQYHPYDYSAPDTENPLHATP